MTRHKSGPNINYSVYHKLTIHNPIWFDKSAFEFCNGWRSKQSCKFLNIFFHFFLATKQTLLTLLHSGFYVDSRSHDWDHWKTEAGQSLYFTFWIISLSLFICLFLVFSFNCNLKLGSFCVKSYGSMNWVTKCELGLSWFGKYKVWYKVWAMSFMILKQLMLLFIWLYMHTYIHILWVLCLLLVFVIVN